MKNKHIDWFKNEHLQENEEVISFVEAQRDKEGFNGVLVLTDLRVAFVRKGTLSSKFEPWPIERISSVETKKGLMFYSITLHTSGDDMELRSVEKDNAAKLVAALQVALHEKPSKVPTQENVQNDPLDKLKKLGELHAAGLLTDAEFAEKKASLLSQI